jgi:hypothetical protein
MDVQVAYQSTPARVVNEALDMLGVPGQIIGDLYDGTVVAETARRNYGQGLRQLLRTAHWDFARKRAKLQLLGDALSGPSIAIGVSPWVEPSWGYAYAWPIDAVMGRWLPWNPTGAQPTNQSGVPLTTGSAAPVGYPMLPGRFLVSSTDQYPIEVGSLAWDQLPDIQRTEGLGPTYRKVILTDAADAHFVYTRLVTTIEEWDSLFRQAFVTMLGLVLLPVAIEDPKVRMAEYDRLAVRLRNAVADARLASANESGFPVTVNHTPDWIRARNQGWGGQTGPGGQIYSGYTFYPWDASMSWCGSVF